MSSSNKQNIGEKEYRSGCRNYERERYDKAEQRLRESVRQRKRALGTKHVKTLDSNYMLALTLHEQQKHNEAENLLQRLIPQYEKALGPDHEDTLWSKFKLALILHAQQKYSEAEQLLRQTVQQQETVIGAEDVDTLDTKYWLALTLYEQQKYNQAEQLLQHTVQQRENVIGVEHVETLNTKHWLARTLLEQQRYSEAEELFQRSLQQREKVLGAEHINTLWSKYWLALTLHNQQKYSEAEQLLQQTLKQREKVMGAEDVETLNTKHWLALTLHEQQKYNEAENLLRELIQQDEKALGPDHKDTLASKALLQEVILAKAPSALSNTLTETVSSRLSNLLAEDKKRQTAYTDSEIQQVSLLLNQLNPQWSKVPRTYIILRTVGCLELLNSFIDLGFSDYWFPVTERGLPHCLHPGKRSQFVAAQKLVMTKSMDLEKGEEGQHRLFQHKEPLPFEEKGILGAGGFGQVDRVLSLISFKEYARKRVPRNMMFGGRKTEDIKRFIAEIEVLKRLKHRHIVEFVGSYTDPKYMALIMSPVADMDLSTYLLRADVTAYKELRTFFGCLTRALEFLHDQRVRHKDIKPGNILVCGGNVLFTDFGLALDFTDAEGSTTVSMVNGITPRYCAPEVANYEPRNTASDIWSLGVVFLEMTAVLKGKGIEYVYDFLSKHGSRQTFVRTNPKGVDKLVARFEQVGDPVDNVALGWTKGMLMTQQNLRPTAASLMASITTAVEGSSGGFCGICCVSPDDFLDDFDELGVSDDE